MQLALPGLLTWIEQDSTVVLPSRLQAFVAYQQFAADRLKTGFESWRRPLLLTPGGWLAASWQAARYADPDAPALLSPPQEHLLWKKTLTSEGVDAFDPDATSRLASRAAQLVEEWQIPTDNPAWQEYTDARHFQQWLKTFRRICKAQGWVARFDVWRRLPAWIEHGILDPPPTVFAGLEATPALDRVVAAAGSAAQLASFEIRTPGPAMRVQRFPSFEQEIEFAARKARTLFEETPAASVTVLVPNLAVNRELVERSFRRACYPGAARVLLDPSLGERLGQPVFHLTTGIPLADEPLLAGALLLLELNRARIPAASAGAIVSSPWIKGAVAERCPRALARAELARRRTLDVSLRDLESHAARCPLLESRLAAAGQRIRKRLLTDSFSGWSSFIADLLTALGWPGDAELSVREQELFELWKDALSEFSALSLVAGPVAWEEALGELRVALSRRRAEFSNAPIQVINAGDAAGLCSDHLLLTGMSEENWPSPGFPSPLVPLKLQRLAGVPAALPEALTGRHQQQLASFLQIAPQASISFSGRPSPLLSGFVSQNVEEIPPEARSLPVAMPPAVLEELEDSFAPPYAPTETTRGGTSMIKTQSLCPFRAFAEYRLAAMAPEEGSLGFDQRDKGGHLHRALHFVWQKLESSARLRVTPHPELERLVEVAANEAVRIQTGDSFGKIVSAIELARLKEIILNWLAVEKQRQHPFTVETLEEEQYAELGGLRLRLRVDRIDRLANGSVLLIDYKSGKQSYTALEKERPAEPQLLVYAAAAKRPVAGLFFAQLKPREQRFTGFSRDRHFRGQANQIPRNWDGFLADAQQVVHRLGAEFLEGLAVVAPAKGACEWCAQKPFCRVNEMRGREEAEE